jgi:hypothetical protein
VRAPVALPLAAGQDLPAAVAPHAEGPRAGAVLGLEPGELAPLAPLVADSHAFVLSDVVVGCVLVDGGASQHRPVPASEQQQTLTGSGAVVERAAAASRLMSSPLSIVTS